MLKLISSKMRGGEAAKENCKLQHSQGGSGSSASAPNGRGAALGSMKLFQTYLPQKERIYRCISCRADLAYHSELISKSFQGSQGRAYLFNSVVNVQIGPAEERVLLTGNHEVADIFCDCCKTTLGWKYVTAFEPPQKYKEGKYIIELAHMIKENGWENAGADHSSAHGASIEQRHRSQSLSSSAQ